MYCEVELVRDVAVLAENFKRDIPVSQRSIITRLLEDLLREKASKDHGYFLAVTGLKMIGKGVVSDESGDVSFPVFFNCRTLLPVKGDILQGVVQRIFMFGVLLRCGPIRYAYLSVRKMRGYRYLPGAKPLFISDELGKIDIDVVVSFMVLDVKWVETNKEFFMLASLEGDSLGPVSLCGSDELDL